MLLARYPFINLLMMAMRFVLRSSCLLGWFCHHMTRVLAKVVSSNLKNNFFHHLRHLWLFREYHKWGWNGTAGWIGTPTKKLFRTQFFFILEFISTVLWVFLFTPLFLFTLIYIIPWLPGLPDLLPSYVWCRFRLLWAYAALQIR